MIRGFLRHFSFRYTVRGCNASQFIFCRGSISVPKGWVSDFCFLKMRNGKEERQKKCTQRDIFTLQYFFFLKLALFIRMASGSVGGACINNYSVFLFFLSLPIPQFRHATHDVNYRYRNKVSTVIIFDLFRIFLEVRPFFTVDNFYDCGTQIPPPLPLTCMIFPYE